MNILESIFSLYNPVKNRNKNDPSSVHFKINFGLQI